jgi:prepilin-type N-terminal cleavage/methylation domain-containing protein
MTPAVRTSRGFTLIELIVVVGIIAVLAAIVVPGLMRARLSGNEASAVGSIRAVISAQTLFSSACGGGGYSVDLADLALPPTAGGIAFIPPDLAAAFPGGTPKSGYEFSVSPVAAADVVLAAADTCNGSANDSETEFFANADPVSPTLGTRFFGTNQSSQIRQNTSAIADIADGIPLQ